MTTAPPTAMVFPGMAPVTFADLGRFLILNPFAKRRVAEAEQRLGYPLVTGLRDSGGDYSEQAQVAFLVSCVALAEFAEAELGVDPVAVTGPSFGEKPLAAYTGALEFSDAVWLTARLSRCLDAFFATEYTDVVTHSFVRVPREKITAALAELADRGEWYDISCYVDEDFLMVSLREHNLDWLQRTIRSCGGLSLYSMRPPMHSTAFGALRRKAEDEVIGALRFADPRLPVIADQDGTEITTGAGVRAMLLDSITTPLRWPEVVAALSARGVRRVCVAGQDTLFGRVPVTKKAFEVLAVDPRTATTASTARVRAATH